VQTVIGTFAVPLMGIPCAGLAGFGAIGDGFAAGAFVDGNWLGLAVGAIGDIGLLGGHWSEGAVHRS
jgi:hypothetical protein